jgi:hypothetical protein
VQCSVVDLVRWSELSWLMSDLFESSAVGSQLIQLGSCSDSQRGFESVNTEVAGSTTLETVTRQRPLKTQQTEKT